MQIIHINLFDEPLPLDEWKCSMMMCPSQCYYHTQKDGIDYLLYLRWRWEDPWQAHIIKNADCESAVSSDKAEWTGNLFDENNFRFSHDEVEQAKENLMALFLSGLPTKRAADACPACGDVLVDGVCCNGGCAQWQVRR
jgi:hypothetical protein